MAAKSLVAEVRLHGRRVGELRYSQGGSEFSYEDDLDSTGHYTLGQVFEDDPRGIRRVTVGVPAWFANLLPEGALRRQIVSEMGGGRIGDFTLLVRLGLYLPGAVTVHSDTEPLDDTFSAANTSDTNHPLRHSLAGVQLKYSVSSARLSTPVTGENGWWIVKLPDPSLRSLAANEFVTMRWLAAAGFPVPAVNLIRAGAVDGIPEGLCDTDTMVYLIERFDRTNDGKIHVEDFAQVADVEPMFKYSESGATYDSLGIAIRQLTGDAGYADYLRRLVAMLIVGNTDAHLKNWALIYHDRRTPSLAPVYDFHSLSVYSTYRWAPLALSLNGETLSSVIDVDDFKRLAEKADADPDAAAETVTETVSALRDAWAGTVREEADALFPALCDHLTHRLTVLPICDA